jgi:hypothetical protein
MSLRGAGQECAPGNHMVVARVADLFTLPYVIERLSPYLPLLGEAAAKCVFLTTGTLRG